MTTLKRDTIWKNTYHKWILDILQYGDGIDTNEPAGLNFLTFKLSFNDYYSQDISNKIKSVKHRKAEKGEFQGSFAPYGYQKDPENKNHLVIDEKTAPVIKRIFEMYLEGNGIVKIANKLNEESIPSPGSLVNSKKFKDCECLWKKCNVYSTLTNVVYIGTIEGLKSRKKSHKVSKVSVVPKNERKYVENMHEPIIDKDVFDAVQKRMKRDGKTRQRKYDHPLKGLVYCNECGSKAMLKVRERKKKSGGISKDIYFICSKKSNLESSCKNGRISEKLITPFVLEELKKECSKIIFSEEDIENLYAQAKKNSKSKKTILIRQIEKGKKEVERIENKITQMYQDKLEGIIRPEDFTKIYNSYQEKKEKLLRDNNDLEIELKECDNKKIISFPKVKKIADECLKLEECNKELLSKLIDRIEYTRDKKIIIKYKFTEQ